MSTPTKYEGHTPGPWRWENVAGAGLQIMGNMPETFTFGEGVFPKGVEVKVFGLPDTTRVYRNGESLIAYERWVRFEPTEWNAMQEANARLIADAPALLADNERLREALEKTLDTLKQVEYHMPDLPKELVQRILKATQAPATPTQETK